MAKATIFDLFLGRPIQLPGVPLVDMASLQWEFEESVKEAWKERRKRLSVALAGVLDVPAAQRPQLLTTLQESTLRQPYLPLRPTPLSAGPTPSAQQPRWQPNIQRAVSMGQTTASFDEQTEAYHVGQEILDAAKSGLLSWVPGLVLVGRAGSGKTHVMCELAMYAIGLGFDIEITALSSKRAQQFGGLHAHKLFDLPAHQSNFPPQVQAKTAIASLSRSPIRWNLLKVTHCFFIEEVGLLSAQTIAAIDCILRYVLNNQVPFGGAIFVGTGAVCQLSQLGGDTFWSSTYLITCFRVAVLKHGIRFLDQWQEEVVDILERPRNTPQEIARVVQLVAQECNYVQR
ncbi:unnamed protein product [Vitrella brassicaformis CCMP3155]|uniref:ATP-dependent DNA helicase n=1 Tax=Vitrella brassicaformis (strain CCMP3155) TaxID=1169540 RepID=A0A0G4E8Y6_VITBC|nr:unnamed protein product [Vitrella brassicaformis CCMP3155]|mmetsp:Transcript_30257/g.75143  ORF Transcript_30257/g.75143 Transcript_30257/m.75143 type:complete len:344 (+) Transcript_30257:1840-2871(+)|eukprot:CEL91666.1 unnamed protein product [Vitrella brassicaformis CCMP3155]